VAVEAFEHAAPGYDAWYDTPLGQAVFTEELAAIQPLLEGLSRPWLEVGVGSGRFASALDVEVGLDPAPSPLRLARARGVHTVRGYGEALPFVSGSFGAVLMVVTLCFVADPLAALREARRVLQPDGGLIVGFIPADGPWASTIAHLRSTATPSIDAHTFSRARSSQLC
jgi:ubiquinone/menaquinone biosynthesis C-methylase UbiE